MRESGARPDGEHSGHALRTPMHQLRCGLELLLAIEVRHLSTDARQCVAEMINALNELEIVVGELVARRGQVAPGAVAER